jgi:nitroreductase
MTAPDDKLPGINDRTAEAAVDPIFLDRWSPRAFSSEPVQEELICAIFEAARWAPSSGNNQPWFYLYADREPELPIFLSCLTERNQLWARQAPVLAFALSHKTVKGKDKPNRWAGFDTGASWMSVALEARKLGLYTHAMAGFDAELVYERLLIPRDKFDIWAAIAIGWMGDPADLPSDFAHREFPSTRKPLDEVVSRGLFPEHMR